MRTFLKRGWGSVVQAYARQPLVFTSISLILGLCGGFCYPIAAARTAFLGGIFLLLSLFIYQRIKHRFAVRTAPHLVLICMACFTVGYLRSWWDSNGRDDEQQRLSALKGSQSCVVRVGSEVLQKPMKGAGARYTFYADACTVQTAPQPMRLCYLPVRVEWYAGIDDKAFAPSPGEVWRLSGKLVVRPLRNGLHEVRLSSGKGPTRSLKLARAASDSWSVRLDRLRRQAVHRVTIGIETWGVIPQLNQAMLLGARHEMPLDMKQIFANSGTIHVFAISGMHIALLAAFFVAVIRLVGVSRVYWGFFLSPLLILYTLISGACPSAIRACIMAIILLFAPVSGRRANGVAALAFTACLVHLVSPALIFNVGSLFSFTVMLGLVLFVRPFSVCMRAWFHCAWFDNRCTLYQSAGNRMQYRLWQCLCWLMRYMSDVLAISLAAWMVSVPLTAYYFGRLTLGGLFANLIITPAAFFVVVAGCLGLFCSYFSTGVAALFNQLSGLFTYLMVGTAETTVHCPGMSFEIVNWTLKDVFLYFVAVALFAFLVQSRQNKNRGLEWLGT